jgi:hypothetical protein
MASSTSLLWPAYGGESAVRTFQQTLLLAKASQKLYKYVKPYLRFTRTFFQNKVNPVIISVWKKLKYSSGSSCS